MSTPTPGHKFGSWTGKDNPETGLTNRVRHASKGVSKRLQAIGLACAVSVTAQAQERAGTRHMNPDGHPGTEQHIEQTLPTGSASTRGSAGEDARRAASDPTTTRSATGRHVDRILDTMVRTERIAPGTPLSKRIGRVDDPRLMPLIRSIDAAIGGGVEWPHVSVRTGMGTAGLNGLYRGHESRDGHTPTTPDGSIELAPGQGPLAVLADSGHKHGNAFPSGIVLDKGLVDSYMAGDAKEHQQSLRSVLVHELQHATSDDGQRSLANVAPDRTPFSETKAQIAALVVQEMVNRGNDGPKLNELPVAERRALLANTIGPNVDQDWQSLDQASQDRMLEEVLTADEYVLERPWENAQRYMFGVGEYDIDGPGQTLYVPEWADEAERAARTERHERYRDQAAQREQDGPQSGPETGNRPRTPPAEKTPERQHPLRGPMTIEAGGAGPTADRPIDRRRREDTPQMRERAGTPEAPAPGQQSGARSTEQRGRPAGRTPPTPRAGDGTPVRAQRPTEEREPGQVGKRPPGQREAEAGTRQGRQLAKAEAARRMLNREQTEEQTKIAEGETRFRRRPSRSLSPPPAQRTLIDVPVRPAPVQIPRPDVSRSRTVPSR